jgi:hypothetical protein
VVAMFSGRRGAHLMRRCAPDEVGRGDRKVEGASGVDEELKRAPRPGIHRAVARSRRWSQEEVLISATHPAAQASRGASNSLWTRVVRLFKSSPRCARSAVRRERWQLS